MSSACIDHSPIVNVVTQRHNEVWEQVEVDTLVDELDNNIPDVYESHELGMEPVITLNWATESEITSSLDKGEDLVSFLIFLSVDWQCLRNLHVSDSFAVQVVHCRDAFKGNIVQH